MKGIHWVSVAVSILVLAALACGGEPTTPEVKPTEAVQPTPTKEVKPTHPPTDTPVPKPEGAVLEITNESGRDVWHVYLSPTKADQWGEDWLGETDVIADGQTYVITGIPEGLYDVRAEDRNQEPIEVLWEVEIEGEMTWTITGVASLEIINQSDDPIFYLYMTPVESDSWGEDWLGDDTIAAGDSYVVENVPLDTYDVKVANSDDESIEVIYNVELSGAKEWTVVGKTPLPDNAVLRFEDDFKDNRNNWGSSTEGEDVFYMPPTEGEYCILIKTQNYTAMEWYEPFTTDEFVAEVSCYVSDAEDASCGLGFGPSIDNIYWFEVSPYDQTFALFLREDAAWQDNLVDWTVSRNINPDGTNYLSLERVGGVVSMYINGVLVSEADGSRFPTGRIGLGGSTYNEGYATICLDNLRVWRLE